MLRIARSLPKAASELFVTPERTPLLTILSPSPPPPVLPAPGHHQSALCLRVRLFFWALPVRGLEPRVVFGAGCLTPSTVSRALPHCSSTSFLPVAERHSTVREPHVLLVRPPRMDTWGVAIGHEVTVDAHVRVSAWTHAFISLEGVPKSRTAGQTFSHLRTDRRFSRAAAPLCVPSMVSPGPRVSTPSQTLVLI